MFLQQLDILVFGQLWGQSSDQQVDPNHSVPVLYNVEPSPVHLTQRHLGKRDPSAFRQHGFNVPEHETNRTRGHKRKSNQSKTKIPNTPDKKIIERHKLGFQSSLKEEEDVEKVSVLILYGSYLPDLLQLVQDLLPRTQHLSLDWRSNMERSPQQKAPPLSLLLTRR